MSKILEQLNNCPNCGGTLNEFGRCNFCGSKVYDFTNIEFDGPNGYRNIKPTYIKIRSGSHMIIAPVVPTHAEIECSEVTCPMLRAEFMVCGDMAMIDTTKEFEEGQN